MKRLCSTELPMALSRTQQKSYTQSVEEDETVIFRERKLIPRVGAVKSDLKILKSEGAVAVCNKHVYRYMFDDLDGLAEIEVDLLRFWWLWRKSKFADCRRFFRVVEFADLFCSLF